MSLQSVREWMGDNPATPPTVTVNADSPTSSPRSPRAERARSPSLTTTALAGMITDGDIRRAFSQDITRITAADVMSRDADHRIAPISG